MASWMTNQSAHNLQTMLDRIAGSPEVKWFPLRSSHPKIAIRVRCLDIRQVYGRVDILITPVEGTGEMWTSLDSLDPIAHLINQ
jgi:hypothetical protein